MAIDRQQIKIQPVELTSLIRQVEETMVNKVNPAVMLNCVPGANSIYVATDPALLRDVLAKMLDNAVKFTERGSITFGYDVSDDEIYFYVKDSGMGVPRNLQDELFEETPDNASTSLIRAKNIVETLGGEIGVDSRGAGKGSTFWFTIPNNEVDQPAGAATAAAAPETTGMPAAQPQDETRLWDDTQDLAHDVTILIAEDNESNFLLFRSILESRYNIIHAYNGQEAVELFSKYNIDLVLMDINMPLKDGYEATREIREVSATVPIVAVTAYAFTTDKQRIYQNGFNGYVSKPISINRLERVINDLLSQNPR